MKEATSKELVDSGPPVAFESWARVAAKMLNRSTAERLQLLRQHAITPEQWSLSDTHWSLLLADEIAAGNHARADIYAAHCAAEFKERREKDAPKPPVEASNPPQAPVAEEEVHEVPTLSDITPDTKPAGVDGPIAPPPLVTKPHIPNELQGTSLALNIPRGPLLPFATKAAGESPLAKPGTQLERTPPAPAPLRGQTNEIPDLPHIARAVMPFRGNTPPDPAPAVVPPKDVPELTLEQYASLCAELELAPEHAQETLQRYRLRTDQKAQVDSFWTARFRTDPNLQAAYRHAKTTYAAWLMNTKTRR